jgi:hypothetical protein
MPLIEVQELFYEILKFKLNYKVNKIDQDK